MDFNNTIWFVLGIIGTIVVSILSNLLTGYLFPDGGKKLISSVTFIVLSALRIIVHLARYSILLLAIIQWILDPNIISSIGLGFNIALITTMNLWMQNYHEKWMDTRFDNIYKTLNQSNDFHLSNFKDLIDTLLPPKRN